MIQRVKTGVIADGAITTAKMNDEVENLFSFRNRIINGDMRIDQRNAGASVTGTTSAFSCDRWKAYYNGTGTITYTQSSVVPNDTFKNSIVATVTSTGTPSEAAIAQYIEGYNIADFAFGTSAATTITASFWVRSSVTGTYCFSLRQGSGARSFVSSFSISSANTWEYKTVRISGDTSGTYNSTNGTGFIFQVCLGASTLQTSTTDSWLGGNFVCTSSQTNLASTNGATFYLTGAQLEVGPVATPFERRPYGMELALCQRYFFQISSTNAGNGENTGITGVSNGGGTAIHRTNLALPVTMRITPTMSVSNVSGGGTDLRAYNGSDVQNLTSLGQQFSNPTYVQADWSLAANLGSAGDYLTVLWKGNINGGWIRLSSEL